jgi:hypothetical protein
MNSIEIKQLSAIRTFIANNAKRGSDSVVVEKWVLDTLQQLDALLANLVASQEPSSEPDDRQEQEEQRMTILDRIDELSNLSELSPGQAQELGELQQIYYGRNCDCGAQNGAEHRPHSPRCSVYK